ncbi:alpha/beta fold hydrolase [Amycolatopsis sp. WQ 127309]|uniref:alpha/beta fold hydrolase n=1 Tax=Amycolatopsis sp. WQ 127309 TaxID=2932773 RepID=UPI001FF19419|nr:alpha/beta hydrolase [Amycolatopsis sp. WQ 127309]UOZ10362.1 alpha/beta hydrolase [Amycolatopsis sp. WQ 127309]
MPDETFTLPGSVTAYRWDPAGPPVGVLQLAHGMGEHVLRYDRVARAFTDRGFAVYGQDHRGHGASIRDTPGDLGPDGWPALVADIGVLTARIREEQPGLPVVLLAHSMGSFAAQQYLLDHSADVDAAVLTGTAALDVLEPALDLDQPLDLAVFNAPFQPPRTDYDWLSRDESEVDAYVTDPLCGFGIDLANTKAMFAGARRLADPEAVGGMRADLPMYLAVGEQDPVNGNLALFDVLVRRYRDAGIKDLTVKVYPGARHEILNETNRAEVVADLLAWTEKLV